MRRAGEKSQQVLRTQNTSLSLIPGISRECFVCVTHRRDPPCLMLVQDKVDFLHTNFNSYICLFFPAQMDPRGLSPRQSKSDSDDDDLPNVTLDSVNETGSTALSIARAVQE